MAPQAPAAVTRRLGGELNAAGQEQGKDAFDQRLAIAQPLKRGRFMLEINGESPVVAGPAERCYAWGILWSDGQDS